jgi:hypothetical protein
MKFLQLVVIASIFSLSCSKSENIIEVEEPNNEKPQEPINLAPGNFEIFLGRVSDSWALVNWTKSLDPEDEEVKYNIILNGSLIAENISDLSYRFEGLDELTDYNGFIVAIDPDANERTHQFSFTTEKYYLKYLKKYDYGETNYGSGNASGSPYSMIKTIDNNYVIAGKSVRPNGNKFQFIVLKTDYEGNVIWKYFYDYELGDDWIFTIKESNDGGYLLVGGPFVLKLDINGNVSWDKRIDSYVDLSYAHLSTIGQLKSVQEDSNGNIYVVGGRGSEHPDIKQQGVLTKLDNTGNIIWEKIYEPSRRNFFNDIILNNSDNLIVLGSTETSGATTQSDEQIDFWVLTLDLEGNIIWESTFGDEKYDIPNQIIATSDNNFVAVGYGASIFKISNSGELIWSNTEHSAFDPTFSVSETNDNGFVTTGKYDFGDYGGLGISKYDSNGNLEWEKTIQEAFTYLIGYSILTEEDGGFRIAGTSFQNYYYGEERPYLLVYKTNPNGDYD